MTLNWLAIISPLSFRKRPKANTISSSAIGPFNYLSIGHTVFALGRFLTALAGLFLKPRRILLILYIGLIITSALAMSLTGYRAIAMVILILFFESGIFSLIFAISLRGLGMHTKWGAILLAAATCGGAVVPAVMNPVASSRGVRYAFCVVVAVFAFGAVMPVYLEAFGPVKRQVDPVRFRGVQSGILGTATGQEEGGGGRPSTASSSRASRAFSAVVRRKKGISAASSDLPTCEHVEQGGRGSVATAEEEEGEKEKPRGGQRHELQPWPD